MVLDRRFEGTQVRFVENFSLEFHSIYEFRRRQRAKETGSGNQIRLKLNNHRTHLRKPLCCPRKTLENCTKEEQMKAESKCTRESFALFGRFDKISWYLKSFFQRSLMIFSNQLTGKAKILFSFVPIDEPKTEIIHIVLDVSNYCFCDSNYNFS
jgi:hypothetical protein